MQVESQGFDVVIKPYLTHGPEHILGRDSLALLVLATVVGFPSHEANELGHAFLDGLFRVIRYLDMWRQGFSHDSDDVGYWHETVLFTDSTFRFVCVVVIVVGVGYGNDILKRKKILHNFGIRLTIKVK